MAYVPRYIRSRCKHVPPKKPHRTGRSRRDGADQRPGALTNRRSSNTYCTCRGANDDDAPGLQDHRRNYVAIVLIETVQVLFRCLC